MPEILNELDVPELSRRPDAVIEHAPEPDAETLRVQTATPAAAETIGAEMMQPFPVKVIELPTLVSVARLGRRAVTVTLNAWPLLTEAGGWEVKERESPETVNVSERAELRPEAEAVKAQVPAPVIVREKARVPEERD